MVYNLRKAFLIFNGHTSFEFQITLLVSVTSATILTALVGKGLDVFSNI